MPTVPSSSSGEKPPALSQSKGVAKTTRSTTRSVISLLGHDRANLPDNIINIDSGLYSTLSRLCTQGIKDGEKNGVVRIILSSINPSIFFISNSVDKIRNFLHESLILGQMGSSGVRFDKDGFSLDAIAEAFIGVTREQLQFSSEAYTENDIKRAHLRNLYKDTEINHAAGMFYMEHPGLIPYAQYITNTLFPFGIGRNCFIGAGGNGVVIRNSESNLAFKFYYDLERKKQQTALKEGPSQVVFAKAIRDMQEEGRHLNYSCPYMEVLSHNHVEMELIDGDTLDTAFKRHLLVENGIVEDADHLKGTDLDIAARNAGIVLDGYTITDMLNIMYGQNEADNFSYFLLELEERGLIHRDIDSSIYSDAKTNVNAKNLMIRNPRTDKPQFVLIDFGNVSIENRNGHTYKEQYNKVSKNGYV